MNLQTPGTIDTSKDALLAMGFMCEKLPELADTWVLDELCRVFTHVGTVKSAVEITPSTTTPASFLATESVPGTTTPASSSLGALYSKEVGWVALFPRIDRRLSAAVTPMPVRAPLTTRSDNTRTT